MQNREAPLSRENGSESGGNNPWAEMAETAPVFGGEKSEEVDRAGEKIERLLERKLSVGAILRVGDEDLAEQRQAVDRLERMGWPIGNEEMAEARINAAKKKYETESKNWRAEQEVLAGIREEYGEDAYSRGELKDRLEDYKRDFAVPSGSNHGKNWITLQHACIRLISRLSNIEEGWATEGKLSEEDRIWLEKVTDEDNSGAGERNEAKDGEPGEGTDEGMVLEDVDTGVAPAQEKGKSWLDKGFWQRIREHREEQRREETQREQRRENEQIKAERQAREERRQRVIQRQREEALRAAQEEAEELEEDNEMSM